MNKFCLPWVLCVLFVLLGIAKCDKDSGGASCTSDLDCNGLRGGGICDLRNSTGTCLCYEEWAGPDCSHERKKQSTAFGLSWLFLLGMPGCGRVYLGHPNGIAELTLGITAILFYSIPVLIWSRCHTRVFRQGISGTTRFPILCGSDDGFITSFFAFIMYPLAIGMSVWGVVDLIVIGAGQLDDFDGYSMYTNLF